MHRRTLNICNAKGLHARAAAKFVTLASSFSSEVEVSKDGQTVNGKSIMGVMMLAAGRGTQLRIVADGADAEEALARLRELIESRFGEDE